MHFRKAKTITITGTDLNDATAARMLWASAGMQFPTTVNALNSNTLEVIMPEVWQEIRDHHLLVEGSTGSTIGIPANSYIEHTTTGALPNINSSQTVIVKAGATLSGQARSKLIVVETGGVFEVDNEPYALGIIIAEDGAGH